MHSLTFLKFSQHEFVYFGPRSLEKGLKFSEYGLVGSADVSAERSTKSDHELTKKRRDLLKMFL